MTRAARNLSTRSASAALFALLIGTSRAAETPRPTGGPPAAPPVAVRTILAGADPLTWNRTLEYDRALGHVVPRWPATRVVDPLGNESLYIFPARVERPHLLAAAPRGQRARHAFRVFPHHRWILLEGPDTLQAEPAPLGSPWRSVRVHAANGAWIATSRACGSPSPLGRDFALWPVSSAGAGDSVNLRLRRLSTGEDQHAWVAGAGYGAASPLENFLAVNLAATLDPATGIRQDLLTLLDLEGTVLWSRPVAADHRDFAVSNFGDVAIARDRSLHVYDRRGTVRFQASFPLNLVGRAAVGADGRYALVAVGSPGGPRGPARVWVALFDTRGPKSTAVWSRRDFAERRGGEVTELSVSDDGGHSLVRFSTGAVLLLGRDGRTVATWDLPRSSGGEYQRGTVPRRTWLSADGSLVALITPVARSLGDARGFLYQVPRPRR